MVHEAVALDRSHVLAPFLLDLVPLVLIPRCQNVLVERVALFAGTHPLLCWQLDIVELVVPYLIELRLLQTHTLQIVMHLVLDVFLVARWKMDLASIGLLVPKRVKVLLIQTWVC